jgi:hypothetical protein
MREPQFEPPLQPCRSYRFLYPANGQLEPRQVFVMRIHDVHQGRQPHRSWLVTGKDLSHNQNTSFLFESMQEVQPLQGLMQNSDS